MPNRIDLMSLTADRMAEFFAGLGLPPARARQVFALIHRPDIHDIAGIGSGNGENVPEFAELNSGDRENVHGLAGRDSSRERFRDLAGMKTVRKEIRSLLAAHACVSRLAPAAVETSRDGTVKFAFRLGDGCIIESVLIPAAGRHTLCVSSQAGCAMGCTFCLTAGMGLQRNLTPAEIVNQVLAVQEHMIRTGVVRATPRQLIDNLVFMGMGEPLANYDNLIAALSMLLDERGQGFSERRVTVSTCGLVPRIADLGREIRVNLAVSLHAADDPTRSRLMPVNRAYGVDEVLAACRAYPLSKRQVIFIECVLIAGLNDSAAAARQLATKLQGLRCRINLLPYNESPSLPYRCAPPENIAAFQDILRGSGFRTLIRNSRGSDIAAACGQLASKGERAATPPPDHDALHSSSDLI